MSRLRAQVLPVKLASMKHFSIRSQTEKMHNKILEVISETVIHRRPKRIIEGVWPFVVFGPGEDGNAVVRVGKAEQRRIHAAPVYIATLSGPHISESDTVPIEEIAGDDVPEELKGMSLCQMSPMRPLSVTSKHNGPPPEEAVDEILELYKGNDTAIIETPQESYWILSVLKYLDESDRFFPDPVVSDFYSRLGHSRPHGPVSGSPFLH